MLKDLWFEYWRFLPILLCAILLVASVRSKTQERKSKFALATICVLVFFMAMMDPPLNYVLAALIVISLLIRETNSDLPFPRLGRSGPRSPSHRQP